MKIGILVTGATAQEVALNHGQHFAMFVDLFNHFDRPIEWVSYIVHEDEFPTSANECDAWLITGSKHGAYDDLPWIATLEQLIRDIVVAKKRLVGICFGHQIIAQAMGGKVVKVDKGFAIGTQEYKLNLPSKIAHLADGNGYDLTVKNSFKINAIHGDQVVALPKSAEVIATSDWCEYAGFYYAEGILSFQSHPEFTNEFLQNLLEFRWQNDKTWIAAEKMDVALAGLNQQTDRLSIAQLLLNFMVEE